ncbi:MAG: arginine deiminase family protein, partial [Thermoanaerobaculales bacterium]|nr:arginine deiminase family protein [Thermoanaerobaculales bacterium]
MKAYGSQSMVEPLKKVLVRRPDEAFGNADPKRWHYVSQPDLEKAQAEHDALVATLRETGCEVLYHQADLPGHADAIFTHDPVIVTDEGSIILRMGKDQRRGEEAAIGATLEELGVPTLATLEGEAAAEGGDLLWLDHNTLAVGRGYRTNAEGLRQLTAALRPLGVDTVEVQLPHGGGPVSCLHLMSMISMLDHDLAVVFPPLVPVPFMELLAERGIALVEVPEEEYPTMGPNVLALAPRSCL